MIEQRTSEWFKQRQGLFTGSEIWKLFAKGRGKDNLFGDTAMTYIKEKAIEQTTGHRQSFTTFAMQHGINHEPIAIGLYEINSKNKVEECGFYVFDDKIGGSPDGVIGGYIKEGIIEVKCPINPKIHIDYLLNGSDLMKVEKKYFYQMQCNMLCAGVDWCDFITYHPYTTPYNMGIHRIERDSGVIDEMKILVDKAWEIKNEIIDSIKKAKSFQETRDVDHLISIAEFP